MTLPYGNIQSRGDESIVVRVSNRAGPGSLLLEELHVDANEMMIEGPVTSNPDDGDKSDDDNVYEETGEEDGVRTESETSGEKTYTVLHWVCQGRHWWPAHQLLPYLVERHGVDISVRNWEGDSSLHLAIGVNSLFSADVARYLLSAGGDMAAVNCNGRFCIDVARQTGQQELVDLLGGLPSRA
ncbi:1-phosphatidylinositol 3-phosphate 5-kinase fab1 [Sphaceloma murrayae]|uniref:1-phosphatidylinositol 3-phosphate 5-kinase fab1 n=1 Tax=Sphaceloma murrayae TaxID=2082308 RepID=A0A2K1QJL5_9PEZI|nr:1-phosphatidylinositol 3-phosphate 5-kinase fab1 [Sphaceloma murrayae]